jgi:hypothetical protein
MAAAGHLDAHLMSPERPPGVLLLLNGHQVPRTGNLTVRNPADWLLHHLLSARKFIF